MALTVSGASKAAPETALPLMILFFVSMVAMFPAIALGAMTQGIDSIFHARWQQAFSEQLWSGEFYPRWFADLNDGFGSPAFFIYPPLSHYVTALFYPVFPGSDTMALRLGISAWIALLASSVGCFYWLRAVFPGTRAAALVGAIAYMLAPYHLFIDIYQRGALAEVWAFVWPPVTLLLLTGYDRFSPRRLALLALSVGGLLATHAPSSLILLPAYFLYAIALDWRARRWGRTVALVLATMLGALIAGAYLGPALTHTQFINIAALFGGRNTASKWLIGSDWPDPGIQLYIEIAFALQIGAALVFSALALSKPSANRPAAIVALVLTLVAAVMMSVASRPIWDLGLPLNRVQFPWRFMILSSLSLALSLAVVLARKPDGEGAGRHGPAAALAACLLAANLAFTWLPFRLPPGVDGADTTTSPFADNWDAPEYQLARPEMVQGIFTGQEKARLLEGQGKVDIRQWRARSIILDLDLATPATVALRQFDYPGWRVDGGSAALVAGEPYLRLSAPAGHSSVRIVLGRTMPETLGLIATLIGVAAVAGLFVWPRQARRLT